MLAQAVQARQAVADALNAEIIELQILRHHGCQAGVVLDHQQVFGHGFSLGAHAKLRVPRT